MFISILIAFVLHGLVFVGIQYGISADEEEPEEQFGPLMITLNVPAQIESQRTAQEAEQGSQRERVESDTSRGRERKQREKKADTASERERFAAEPTRPCCSIRAVVSDRAP